MNLSHRSKLSYYKQIYQFESMIAQLAHPSWLEGIVAPEKFASPPENLCAFQSQVLLQGASHLDGKNLTEHSVLLFIASLPKAKLNRFLKYALIAFLKNDKSLLINGLKLKKLMAFFSSDEMDFLIREKEVKIKAISQFSLCNEKDITEEYLDELSFAILKSFFNKKTSPILERLEIRFPKEFSEIKNSKFNFHIDINTNISTLSLITQALFPEIYSVFESEIIMSAQELQLH